jgi:ADP-heptose:LPS heptosyltransferase
MERIFSINSEGKILNIAIHPGARGKLRQWRADRFGTIARMAKKRYDARIIIIGGPGDEGLIQKVEAHMGSEAFFTSTELDLLQLAGLLSRCHLFIGNDSAPGHIAAGVGCPTVTLFGPTFPHMWRPLSVRGEVIFKEPPCCGCKQIECTMPDNKCMDMITVEEVWERVESIINNIDWKR